MEVATETNLLQLEFIRTKDFSGAANGVVPGVIKILNEVAVEANLRREKFRIEDRRRGSCRTVEPAPISIGKRLARALGLSRGWARIFGLRAALYAEGRVLQHGAGAVEPFGGCDGRFCGPLILELCFELLDTSFHLLQFVGDLIGRGSVCGRTLA